MNQLLKVTTSLLLVIILSGCSNDKDPGPLEGTWQSADLFGLKVTFREGETESLGMIDTVTYEVRGKDVIVTYHGGMTDGAKMRFTVESENFMHTEIGRFTRVK